MAFRAFHCVSLIELNAFFKMLVSVGFFGNFEWLLLLVGYLYLASKWPKLIRKWYEVDQSMQRVYGYPDTLNVRFKLAFAVLLFNAGTCVDAVFCS